MTLNRTIITERRQVQHSTRVVRAFQIGVVSLEQNPLLWTICTLCEEQRLFAPLTHGPGTDDIAVPTNHSDSARAAITEGHLNDSGYVERNGAELARRRWRRS